MSSILSLVPRDSYAALDRCTYLNQASIGLIPVPTIDAMDTFLRETAQFGNLYLSDDPGSHAGSGRRDRSDDGVVAFSVVQYATGTRVDARRVAERAREVGARVVVDATQLVGAGVVDTTGWGADALVTSGYKWLSAHGGVALLALAPDLVRRLPRLVGWMGARDPFAFDPRTLRLAADARRFELSTMSYVSAVGLEASIAMLSSLGFERIDRHARRLATYLVDRVAELGWRPFRPPGDPSASSHIVSLRHADHDPGVTRSVSHRSPGSSAAVERAGSGSPCTPTMTARTSIGSWRR
jgi:kynureninase